MTGKCRTVEHLGAQETKRLKGLLNEHVRPHLARDVSTYARGRSRCWLEQHMPL